MKYIFIFLLLIPISSAINITIDYPNSATTDEEIKFDICIINSTKTYDLKIDIFQNDKRVSKILNDEIWTSSIYYFKDSISECSKFYLKINNESIGESIITVKLRDSKNKVITFSPYFISITENKNSYSKKNKKIINKIKDKEEKIINFSTKPREKIIPKTIILSPKAFNTNKNSKKSYTTYAKYSFVLFSIIITVLYLTKPRKKENEFR